MMMVRKKMILLLHLRKSDFIVCGEGDPDLFSTYKTQLQPIF
jgi:hypothetical protein